MKSIHVASERIRLSFSRLPVLVGLASCLLVGTPVANAAESLADVVAGAQRSPANQKRDVYRHPIETLQFFGIQPSQTIVEIEPGGGWYTEILAPYLRGQGKLYEAPIADASDSATIKQSRGYKDFVAKLNATPAVYDKVAVGALLSDKLENIPTGTADMVVTFRNIHNWIQGGKVDTYFHTFYSALKPGGVLGVEEHRAKAGASLQSMIDSGYVTQDYVIEHARSAGFVLVGSAEINANPRDDTNHPNGVWSLPPTLQGGDKDRDQFLAIGESDRMTLKFIKPKQ